MTTPEQIAANRRNAARSTGPKSAEGRAASAQNALRHGLRAEQVVIFDESAEDFAAFHRDMLAALAPADAEEEQLAERIILCHWRLRRTPRSEAALFAKEAAFLQRHARAPHAAMAIDDLVTLHRYETALQRVLDRAQAALERRQARRAGEKVMAPIEVQVVAAGEH